MCGIGGMIGTNIQDIDIEVVRNLGLLNMLRGEHSTGMFDFVPKAEKPIKYWKRKVDSILFINDVFYPTWNDRWGEKTRPNVIAYHCRHATQGTISQANAHPFHKGSIIGMHNGTIAKSFENRKKFDTDSEALFHNIDAVGVHEALKDIKWSDPAYALVYLNIKDSTLNFIRNTKRPLHYNKYLGTFFFSSDAKHLEVACAGNGYKTVPVSTPFKPYTLYSFDLKDKNYKMTMTDLEGIDDYTQTTTVGYTSNYSYSFDASEDRIVGWGVSDEDKEKGYNQAYSHYDSVSGKWFTEYQINRLKEIRASKNTTEEAKQPSVEKKKTEEVKSSVVPFVGGKAKDDEKFFRVGPGYHSECTESAYRSKLKRGCEVCGEKASIHDKAYWIASNEYLCDDCAGEIVLNTQHWVRDHAYLKPEQLAQLEKDYYSQQENVTHYGAN